MSAGELIRHLIFAMLALVTVGGAIKVASTRSIIHAAFWLFPVFAGIAGLYLFLDAQFLAAIQVLIYIGAILLLIIFAVTLTRQAGKADERQSNRLVIPVVLSALALLGALVGAALVSNLGQPVASIAGVTLIPDQPAARVTEVSAIGMVLLQQYLLPFEIASVLLLAAMIGALVLARKERNGADAESQTKTVGAEKRARGPAGS